MLRRIVPKMVLGLSKVSKTEQILSRSEQCHVGEVQKWTFRVPRLVSYNTRSSALQRPQRPLQQFQRSLPHRIDMIDNTHFGTSLPRVDGCAMKAAAKWRRWAVQLEPK